MSKRSHFVALSAVIVVTLAVLNLPGRHVATLKSIWGSTYVPLFGLAASSSDLTRSVRYAVLPKALLTRELESLRKENALLKIQAAEHQSLLLESQRLRQALNWTPPSPWRLKLARVISHDPANWWRSITIDLGKRDGIQTNLTVLTPEGLVGRVADVSFTRSRVLLVGDPNCRFSGLVEQSRDKGIISPDEGSFDRQVVNLTYVPTGAKLQPGARIVTSGDGGVFPKGIPVGLLIDVQTNDYELYLEARVRLTANLNHLEEVWVLFP